MFDRPARVQKETKSPAVVAAEHVVAAAATTARVGSKLPHLLGFIVCGLFTLIWGMAALASVFFQPATGVGIGLMTLAVGYGAKWNWQKLKA